MSEEELKKRVDDIIATSHDDERAHCMEDHLHLDIIGAFCPLWVVAEVQRLSDVNFCRWYA